MGEPDQGARGDGAGHGPGRRRPSRRMRERADEMADMLALAAPHARERRRRRSVAIPAAVVALGALTVGGVGVAVGLDADPTDVGTGLALPVEPGGGTPVADPGVRATTSAAPDAPESRDGDDDTDPAERTGVAASAGTGAPPRARVRAPGAPVLPERGPARPSSTTRAGTSTRPSDDTDDTDHTGRSDRADHPDEADDSEPTTTRPPRGRSEDPGGRSGAPRSGGGPSRGTDLRADSRGVDDVLPSRSPTGDGG